MRVGFLVVLALFVVACSGPAEQTPNPCHPAEGAEAGPHGTPAEPTEGEPTDAKETEAAKNARLAAANTGPVGGEATKTGGDPQESKLTEGNKLDINAVLKANREQLTDCYDKPLANITVPEDGFLVKAGFTIEADGTVKGATIVESTQTFAEAEECFLLQLATIKFPSPPEGRVIETTYPFKIKRKK